MPGVEVLGWRGRGVEGKRGGGWADIADPVSTLVQD